MSVDREQSIRERAYQIWEQEGRPHARNLLHWLQAEAEIGIVDTGRATRKSSRTRRTSRVSRLRMAPGLV